jgi:hypothetical protein
MTVFGRIDFEQDVFLDLFLWLDFFSLEIKVEGFPTTDSLGRKSY